MAETVFTPAKVSNGLKKLFSLDIADDPRIEAQPLYVPGLTMSDGKKHNVVYVFSMANTVWAFDADTGARIWQNPVSLGKAFLPKVTSAPGQHRKTEIDLFGINIHWGILSTPVIDLDTQTMYAVNWVVNQQGKRALLLHALRLSDGKELPIGGGTNTRLVIEAMLRDAAGKPVTDTSGQPVALHPDQKQRAALLLVPLHGNHKTLFVAITGGENPRSPRGWVIAYDVESFRKPAAWVATPSSFGGGIWQASQGPAADEDGNVYVMTGNGGYRQDKNGITDFNGKTDFAEAFVKLRYVVDTQGTATLTLVDWFIPFLDSKREEKPQNYRDQDLGSGAPVVPPGMNLVLGAGKDGVLYVLDRNNMGKAVGDFSKLKAPPIFFTYFPGFAVSPTGNLDFPGADVKTHHLHGSPVFWNSPDRGPMLLDWGENESLRAWTLNSFGAATFVAKSAEIASQGLANPSTKGEGGMPGGMLTLSANGSQRNTGIVWATAPITGNANQDVVEGIVRAYDATTLENQKNTDGSARLKLLWDSNAIPNNRFSFSKFCSPFVADGKLFVTTYGSWPDVPGNHGRVDVYAPE
jgi:outer membrane protein assembly factor BamB